MQRPRPARPFPIPTAGILELPESAVGHDPNGHAIHGFCLDREWQLVEHDQDYALGREPAVSRM